MKLSPQIKTRLDEMVESLYKRTYDQEAADRYYNKVRKSCVTQTFNWNQFHILSPKECAMVAFIRIKPGLWFWDRIILRLYMRKLYE